MGFKVLPEVFFGPGSIQQLPEIIKGCNARHLLVVTDQGIVKCGVAKKILSLLDDAKITYVLFDQVEPDPTDVTIMACVEKYKEDKPDMIIAVGGGSCMDFGKAANVLLYNPGSIQDYKNQWDAIPNPVGPLICIPTTAGTGSEMTDFAVVTDTANHQKVNLIGKRVHATYSIVDPELTFGLPASITAATGMDALTHAIECYACKTPNVLSDMLALKAISLISGSLLTCVNEPSNAKARTDVMMGSMLAGCAFANALLGLVHGIAHPLGAVWHVPHGVGNALALPYVLEYEIPFEAERLENIGISMGMPAEGLTPKKVVDEIKALRNKLPIPAMKDYGIKEDDLDRLADLAMQEMGYSCNPVQPSKEELLIILRNCYFNK